LPETVLLIDGVPDSVSCGGSITGEAFGVFNQVDIVTLSGGVQEAKVGIPIVAPWQLVDLIPVQWQMR
jgi:hypothetical protein